MSVTATVPCEVIRAMPPKGGLVLGLAPQKGKDATLNSLFVTVGTQRVDITDRNVVGSVTFEATTAKNWFASGVESHACITTLALNIVHGTVSGNIVKISAPAVQITNISESNSDGLFVYTCDLSFVPVSGNDEFTITTY